MYQLLLSSIIQTDWIVVRTNIGQGFKLMLKLMVWKNESLCRYPYQDMLNKGVCFDEADTRTDTTMSLYTLWWNLHTDLAPHQKIVCSSHKQNFTLAIWTQLAWCISLLKAQSQKIIFQFKKLKCTNSQDKAFPFLILQM